MSWIARTLWELLGPPDSPPTTAPQRSRSSATRRVRPIDLRYDALVVDMKRVHGIRIVRWRNSSSGCAWEVRDRVGHVKRLIEAPRPRGPISCAIFLHEVGHHAIGFNRYSPRCLEEYHAWRWALATMREYRFNVTPAVEKRMRDALRYAVYKARRRGLRQIPRELLPFLVPMGCAAQAAPVEADSG